MKAKVIIAQATAETAEALYGLVKKMVDTTAIKAYPSVDYQAVFFSADRYDLDFVKVSSINSIYPLVSDSRTL
ncbi:hypothetical protein LI140_21845, partial [Phocaeicola dorei]|nr:DNA-directed RNA polymerase subunit beta [Phocaeicola dorei]MBV4242075.1 DNA-directed RNA polymerase subunit beta [Phocaeicola dorei]MCB6464843.1 hypothetical protein [Phocaeicola dorei]MCB6750233.1 hypothetical protein [Phocaeicola dorei]MCB6775431.1 hypothetical protein [Phocaeicola dorei]MCB6794365.1 hypothetical protein [Phocaeicola dorei]